MPDLKALLHEWRGDTQQQSTQEHKNALQVLSGQFGIPLRKGRKKRAKR